MFALIITLIAMIPTIPNKSIKVLICFIFLNLASFNSFSQTIIDIPITSAAADFGDDAEQRISDGVMDIGSSDLEFCEDIDDGVNGNQLVGIRFQNVNVPQGAIITNAYVQFDVDESTTGLVTIDIVGIDVDNAAQFTTSNSNISDRTDGTLSSATTATTSWSPPDWNTIGANGLDQRTSDISTIVKEIVDRGGWSSGNAMAFVFSANSGAPNRRTAEDGDSAGHKLELHIEYTVPIGPEINLLGNSTAIQSGDVTPTSLDDTRFTSTGIGIPITHTFTIQNIGTTLLNLTGGTPLVDISGDPEFTITVQPPASTIAASGSTTFTIQYNPTDYSTKTATISIDNDDGTPAEMPYTFTIEGYIPNVDNFGPGGEWKYLDDGIDQGTAWQASAFDDSTWASGDAELGFGDGDETTTVADVNQITTYFRKSFIATATDVTFTDLALDLTYDDGAVVYLNGIEIWRVNMPGGVIGYGTFSSADSGDNAFATTTMTNPLVLGTNVIAVEIHQRTATSSDISFNLDIELANIILAADGVWSYYDQGSEPADVGANNWKELAYVESWPTGNAEFGYGEGDETTIIGYGGNALDKYITTYFRKTITASGTDVTNSTLQISAVRDDGIVIYVNGVEVLRNNMPTGTIGYSTTAFGNVSDVTEDFESFWNIYKVANTLVSGSNEIAVEIHQYSNTSSDLSFNLALETNNDFIIVPSIKPDKDTDGVEDYLDADDDNDGIPDVVEGCYTSLPETLETDGDGETTLTSFPITTPLNDGNSITYSVNNFSNFGYIHSYDAGEHGYGLRLGGPTTDGQLTLDFATPVSNLFFKLIDFDESEEIKIDVYDEFGVIVDLSTEEGIYHLGSYIDFIGSNTIEDKYDAAAPNNNRPENRADDIYGAAYFYFPSINVSKVVYTVNYTGGGTIRVVGVQYCSKDTDSDGIDDFYDSDSDNDGIPDIVEAGGTDTDGDGEVDTFVDIDGDGVSSIYDTDDSTYFIEETGKLTNFDFDGDGINNQVDLDSDNDGILDIIEISLPDINGDGQIDGFTDVNNDGYHDSFDGAGSKLITGADTDADGLPNSYPNANKDLTGAPNFKDIDSDDDGITDHTEAQNTTATFVSFSGVDTDDDGILDVFDNFVGFAGNGLTPEDSDSDGTPDYLDDDSDNDAEDDILEGHDSNGDGVINVSDLGACLSSITSNNGDIVGTDTDGDGLDDGFDNDNISYDPSNGGVAPTDHPNIDDIATDERDWREPSTEYNLIDFDGVNDYIDFADSHNMTSSFTFQTWVKQDATSTGNGMLVSKTDCNKGMNLGYRFSLISHFPNIKWYDNTGTLILDLTSGHAIGTDRWYHLSITYDEPSTTAKIYIDGVQVAIDNTVTEAPSTTNESFLIGAKFDDADLTNKLSNQYKGWMDEVRIWSVALTENQIRETVYQEIEISGPGIKGKIVPTDILGLNWTNDLKGYYTFNNIASGDLIDDSSNAKNGRIRNITTTESQTAPIPYTTIRDGNWTDNTATTPWTYGDSVWDIPNSLGIDGSTKVDWPIVVINKNIVDVDVSVNTLALISYSDALVSAEEITDSQLIIGTAGGSHELNVSKYLKLDGKIDLENESQLIQSNGSQLDVSSKGYVERDQQGTENAYTYNYWSSPVSLRNISSNNAAFTVADVLRGGTNPTTPKTILFNDSYSYADGALSDPLKISTYWIWKFVNLSNEYANWQHVREDGILNVTEGYTMKGTSGASAITDEQNYVYRGKPNNGDLTHTTFPGFFDTDGNPFVSLTGNPYSSALDADAFIDDNIDAGGTDAITGTLYFWEHWSNNTHYLSSYQGGYALYTKMGGTVATSHPNIDQGGSGNKTAPGQYIPVAQGFFVTQEHDLDGSSNPINPSSGSVVFKNSQRVFEIENGNSESIFTRLEASKGNLDTPPKSDPFEPTDIKKRIWLGFESPTGFHRQILAGFITGASDAIDRGYDGRMIDLLPNDAYFIQEHQPFSIVAFEKFDVEREIPISVIIDEENDGGTQKIMIDDIDNIAEDVHIYIKDNITNVYYDLRKEACEIQLAAGTHEGRFSLVFKVQESLSVDDDEILKDNLIVFMNNATSEIQIRNNGDAIVEKVILYNSLGQTMNTWKQTNFKTEINLPVSKLSTGVYIVNLETDKGMVTKKVIIE